MGRPRPDSAAGRRQQTGASRLSPASHPPLPLAESRGSFHSFLASRTGLQRPCPPLCGVGVRVRAQRTGLWAARPPDIPPDAQLSAFRPSGGCCSKPAFRKPWALRAVVVLRMGTVWQEARAGPGGVPGSRPGPVGALEDEWQPEAPPRAPTDSGCISSRIQLRHLLVFSSV